MEFLNKKRIYNEEITAWNYYEKKEDYKQRYKRFVEAKEFLLKCEKIARNPILSYTAEEGRENAERRKKDMKETIPYLKRNLLESSFFLKSMKESFLIFQKENEENLDFSNDSDFEDDELELNNFKKRYFKMKFFKNYGNNSFFDDYDYSYKKK